VNEEHPMTAICDYARLYEEEFRPRRRLRRAIARGLWGVLWLVHPKLALRIWRERG
jgi:hypothetical protein